MSDITQLVELWIRPSKMTGKNSSKALDIRKLNRPGIAGGHLV